METPKQTQVPRETKTPELTKPKTERSVSVTYTLKSFSKSVNKMKKAKMITEDEHKTLSEMYKNITARWIGLEL